MLKDGLKTLLTVVNSILYLVIIALWLSISDEWIFVLAVTLFNLCLTLFLLYISRDRFKTFYQSHFFSRFAQALVSLFLFFCLLGILNHVAYKNPFSWDLTREGRNQLSLQTQNIVRSLEKEAKIEVYARTADFGSIRQLLELYRILNPSIQIEYIDHEIRPDRASRLGIRQERALAIFYGEKKEIITDLSEVEITSAFVRLITDRHYHLAFLSGLGNSFSESDEKGFGQLIEVLRGAGFQVSLLNIFQAIDSFDDFDVFILWGAERELSGDDLEILNQVIERRKGLIIGQGPMFGSVIQSALRSWMTQFGIKISNDIVIDQIKHVSGSDGTIPLLDRFDDSFPLTKTFQGPIFFPLTSSVTQTREFERDTYPYAEIELGLKTMPFPASWGERDLEQVMSGVITFDDQFDLAGPIPLGATISYWQDSGHASPQNLVLFGNSSFVSNLYRRFDQNFLLFINAVYWAAGEERLISLEIPSLKNSPVFIAASQLGIIFYFSVIFSPLLLFSLAIAVYRRRWAGK